MVFNKGLLLKLRDLYLGKKNYYRKFVVIIKFKYFIGYILLVREEFGMWLFFGFGGWFFF